MKKYLIFLLSVVTILSACQKEPIDSTKEIFLLVDSKTHEFMNWGSDMPNVGIKVKELQSVDWSVIPLNGINGFTFEQGYEYKLSVLKTKLANPPMDGSDTTYQLIEILSKTQVFVSQELQQHNGEISQFVHIASKRQYAGAGYDIMGEYCGYYSVKEPVLDLSKLGDDNYVIFRGASGDSQTFLGVNAAEFLNDIKKRTGFGSVVPQENRNDLLFTGTFMERGKGNVSQASDPFDYSSQFSFVLLNNNFINARHLINSLSLNDKYFTDEFKSDLQTLNADEIITKYGTHIIVEAFVGLATHAIFRSINIAYTESSAYGNALYYASKLVNPQYAKNSAIKVNYGTTTLVEFKGGDSSLIPTLAVNNDEVIQSWNEAEMAKWRASYGKNEALIQLRERGLVLLYSMIKDVELQAKIKDATIRYIKSKQLDIITTIPLIVYEQIDGNGYYYNTARQDCKAIGVLASLYKTQKEGTSPLYLYSNDNTERLSFDGNLGGDMVNQRVIGYCYKELVNNQYDVLTEITDGIKYQYMLNGKADYSDKWQETGVRIYTKRINRL